MTERKIFMLRDRMSEKKWQVSINRKNVIEILVFSASNSCNKFLQIWIDICGELGNNGIECQNPGLSRIRMCFISKPNENVFIYCSLKVTLMIKRLKFLENEYQFRSNFQFEWHLPGNSPNKFSYLLHLHKCSDCGHKHWIVMKRPVVCAFWMQK